MENPYRQASQLVTAHQSYPVRNLKDGASLQKRQGKSFLQHKDLEIKTIALRQKLAQQWDCVPPTTLAPHIMMKLGALDYLIENGLYG